MTEFIAKAKRAPVSTASRSVELTAALYLCSAMERRYSSTSSGEQLSQQQVTAWGQCLAILPDAAAVPQWQEDAAYLGALMFFSSHRHLEAQKLNKKRMEKASEEERQEDRLARALDGVRRAKVNDVIECTRRKRTDRCHAKPVLIRRRLCEDAVQKWEAAFGSAWHWLPGLCERLVYSRCVRQGLQARMA